MKKYFCPWCDGTTCCIKSMKKHIKELHEDQQHWTHWIYDLDNKNNIVQFSGPIRKK